MLKTKNQNEKILRRLEDAYEGSMDRPSLKEREEEIREFKKFLSSYEEEAKKLFSEKMEIELSTFLGEKSSTSEVEEKIKLLTSQKKRWERFDLEREKQKLFLAQKEFEKNLAHLASELKDEGLLKEALRARKERRDFSVKESDRLKARVIWLAILAYGEEWLLKHY